MATKDDGGPAFPHVDIPRPGLGKNVFDHFTGGGMSLREWFAGQALAGYFANKYTGHGGAANNDTAEYMFAIADAMVAAARKAES